MQITALCTYAALRGAVINATFSDYNGSLKNICSELLIISEL
jgi:hypothetical protein